MAALDLSICTVLYKTEALSRRFHRELLMSLAPHSDVEVLYHDNSPTDVLSDLPASPNTPVHYTFDPRNLGFSYANNRLLARARHDRILLLNPDVFGFTTDFWVRLMQRPRGAAIFARLLNADGSFQDCVGDTASIARALRPARDYSGISEVTPVGMGIMAFMLSDRQTFARVGPLDEDYPLYGEDMDWCYRAGRCGVPVLYDPGLELTHVGGASAADRWNRVASLEKKYAAERIFVRKHFRGLRCGAMLALNRLKVARMRLRGRAQAAS